MHGFENGLLKIMTPGNKMTLLFRFYAGFNKNANTAEEAVVLLLLFNVVYK